MKPEYTLQSIVSGPLIGRMSRVGALGVYMGLMGCSGPAKADDGASIDDMVMSSSGNPGASAGRTGAPDAGYAAGEAGSVSMADAGEAGSYASDGGRTSGAGSSNSDAGYANAAGNTGSEAGSSSTDAGSAGYTSGGAGAGGSSGTSSSGSSGMNNGGSAGYTSAGAGAGGSSGTSSSGSSGMANGGSSAGVAGMVGEAGAGGSGSGSEENPYCGSDYPQHTCKEGLTWPDSSIYTVTLDTQVESDVCSNIPGKETIVIGKVDEERTKILSEYTYNGRRFAVTIGNIVNGAPQTIDGYTDVVPDGVPDTVTDPAYQIPCPLDMAKL